MRRAQTSINRHRGKSCVHTHEHMGDTLGDSDTTEVKFLKRFGGSVL